MHFNVVYTKGPLLLTWTILSTSGPPDLMMPLTAIITPHHIAIVILVLPQG